MSSSLCSFLCFLCASRSIHAVRPAMHEGQGELALHSANATLGSVFSGGSMARVGLLSGDNPCSIREDKNPAEWEQTFEDEILRGQREGETHKVVIRIGTMGSGKSSAVNAFLKDKFGWSGDMFQIIDLDRMVTSSKAYRDEVCDGDTLKSGLTGLQMGDAWWAGQVATKGYDTVKSITERVSKDHMTFSIEQTGKFMCPLKSVCRKLFKKGYHVIGASPYVPFYILKGRVAKRAEEEGRDVSTAELIGNCRMMLPKIFDMALQTDEFYILNNDVPRGDNPEVLMEQKIDWSKHDNQECSARTIDGDKVQTLLDKVKAHESEYESIGEKEVFKIEKEFLEQLKAAASSGDPCKWA